MKPTSIALLLSLCSLGVTASAWEYPRYGLRSSLKSASLAFRGRVVRLQQVERKATYTRAVAAVRISECLVGECPVGKEASVEYWPQSITEEVDPCFGLPTTVPLGADMVFVFSGPATARGTLQFHTCTQQGKAAAFVLGDEPDGYPVDDPYGDYRSVWGDKDPEPITGADVRTLSLERQQELKR